MSSAIDYALEPDERIIGEYRTKFGSEGGETVGDQGVLVLTTSRIMFYKKNNFLKKLFNQKLPQYDLFTSIYLLHVMDVAHGGTFDKYIRINGKKYYLDGVRNKVVSKLIKGAINDAKSVNVPSPPPLPPIKEEFGDAGEKPVFCKHCGKLNPKDSNYCNGCGTELV